MAQQFINPLPKSGTQFANIIDANFSELYDSLFDTPVYGSINERDVYYSSHLNLLLTGLRIIVNTGSQLTFQVYGGSSNPPSYNDTLWINTGAIDLTAYQIKEMYESNPDTNTLTDAKNSILNLISESSKGVVVDGAIKATEFIGNTGTFQLDDAVSMSSNSRGIEIKDNARNKQKKVLTAEYTSSGTSEPTYPLLNTIVTTLIQSNQADTSGDFYFSYTTTSPTSRDGVSWFGAIVKPFESGSGKFVVSYNDISGVKLVTETVVNFTPSDVGVDTSFNLSNTVELLNGETLYIEYLGVPLYGQLISGRNFNPRFSLKYQNFTNENLRRDVISASFAHNTISLTKRNTSTPVTASMPDATTGFSGAMSATDKLRLDDIYTTQQIVGEPSGIVDATQVAITKATTSLFNRVTVAPVSTSFDYLIKGKKYTISTSKTVTFTDVEGKHFLYLDSTLTLRSTNTFDMNLLYKDNVLVCWLYWDADNKKILDIGNELHGVVMDYATHKYAHENFRARFNYGLGLFGFSIDGTGSENANAQFRYEAGKITDEDLEHIIAASANPAQIPIFYLEGTGKVRKKEADNFPLIGKNDITVTTRPKYNLFSGGAWSLAQVPSDNYFLMHYFATNSIYNKVIGWVGNQVYTNITNASNGVKTEINSLTGLPFEEFVPIGSVIVTTNSYSNTPNAKFVSNETAQPYLDFRGGATYVGSVNPSDHQNLTNRTATGAHPASSISFTSATGLGSTNANNGIDEVYANLELHKSSSTAHAADFITYDNTGRTFSLGNTVQSGINYNYDTQRTHEVAATSHNATQISYDNTGRTFSLGNTTQSGINYNYDTQKTHELSTSAHSSANITFDPTGTTLTQTKVDTAIKKVRLDYDTHIASNDVHSIKSNNFTQHFWVDSNGLAVDNLDGSLKNPFRTIVEAISKTTSDTTPIVSVNRGTYTENITALSKRGLLIEGYACKQSYLTQLNGYIDLDTPMNRFRLRDFQINSPTVTAYSDMSSSEGRHILQNVSFISTDATQTVKISGLQNWITFQDCDIAGRLTISNSTATYYIIGQSNAAFNIVINSNATVMLLNSVCANITANSGTVYISASSQTAAGAIVPKSGAGTAQYIIDPNVYTVLANYALKSAANAFTGNNTFAGTSTFNGASTFGSTATFNGAQTFNAAASFTSTSTFGGASTFNSTVNAQGSSLIQLGASEKIRVDSTNVSVNAPFYLADSTNVVAKTGFTSIIPSGDVIYGIRGDGTQVYFDLYRYSFKDANYTARAYDAIFVTANTPITISLPSNPELFHPVRILSKKGTSLLTISGNGKSISVYDANGSLVGTDTAVTTVLNRVWTFRYVGTNIWELNL